MMKEISFYSLRRNLTRLEKKRDPQGLKQLEKRIKGLCDAHDVRCLITKFAGFKWFHHNYHQNRADEISYRRLTTLRAYYTIIKREADKHNEKHN